MVFTDSKWHANKRTSNGLRLSSCSDKDKQGGLPFSNTHHYSCEMLMSNRVALLANLSLPTRALLVELVNFFFVFLSLYKVLQ